MPATRRSICRRSSTSSARSRVDLPPRPLLLTFDDARADSWTGGDAILKKLDFTAVMFVDVGRVDAGDREYLTWKELESAQGSGRWQLQLHSGKGHMQIQYGPGDDDFGPFYAYKEQGEDFDGWQKRVRSDIEWGQDTLADHISAYAPLAFAPPYGSYGQDGTNDPKIPDDLLGWLANRYDAIFTQDVSAHVRPGDGPAARPIPGDPPHHRRRAARPTAVRRHVAPPGLFSRHAAVTVDSALRAGCRSSGALFLRPEPLFSASCNNGASEDSVRVGAPFVLVVWLVIVVALAVSARARRADQRQPVAPRHRQPAGHRHPAEHFPAQANGTNAGHAAGAAGKKLSGGPYKAAIDQVVKAYRDSAVQTSSARSRATAPASSPRTARSATSRSRCATARASSASTRRRRSSTWRIRPKAAGVRVAAGGYLGQKVSKPGSHTSEVVGIVAAVVILLLTFGSAVAMALPIGTAILGLVAGLGIVTVLGPGRRGADDRAGAGHDDRPWRRHRLRPVHRQPAPRPAARRHGGDESVARATATSGGAVVFAGGTVIIALLSLALSRASRSSRRWATPPRSSSLIAVAGRDHAAAGHAGLPRPARERAARCRA